jgi:glutathione S-transferase
MTEEHPVLWHLKVSHYNEKARWAMDYKAVPHVRRASMPPVHTALARKLTDGKCSTLPVLVTGGEAIGDSSRIIAAVEERWPDPPLYPADAGARERALELEDHFDEELGPHTRLLVVHLTMPEAPLWLDTFVPDVPRLKRLVVRLGWRKARQRLIAAFGIDEGSVALAYEKIAAAGEVFRSQVGSSGHLVGDSFSVADLTLAALVGPAICPPEWPYPQAQRGHPRLAPLREAIAKAGLDDWARDIYARHRGVTAAISG